VTFIIDLDPRRYQATFIRCTLDTLLKKMETSSALGILMAG
jgi:hypothetical protein